MRKLALLLSWLSLCSILAFPVTSAFAGIEPTKRDVQYYAARGEVVALLPKHFSKLKAKYPALYEKVRTMTRDTKFSASELSVLAPMTMETLRTIRAGQAAPPASQPAAAQPAAASGSDDGGFGVAALMGGCFGGAGALLILPHPFSYIAAGLLFVACTFIFIIDETRSKAVQDFFGLKKS